MEINVLLTKKFFEEDITYLNQSLLPEVKLIIPKDYGEENLLKYATDANVFLGGLISEPLCDASPNLKFIQIPWTGVDNLNFDTIQKIGVRVCNSHSNATAVAEHALALLFDAAKKISYHDHELRQGNWNRPKTDNTNEVSPFSKKISGKKIGIIGYGHIGKRIQTFLSGFNCEFYISSTSIKQKYSEGNKYFYPSDSFDAICFVDYLFICVPLTDKTKGFMNKNVFDSMKNSSVLINTSRGEVLNEVDLYNALKNNDISGAGIDTWYNYPKNSNEPTMPSLKSHFWELDNIVMSPHRAGFIENELPHLDDAIININRTVYGFEPFNIISLKNKY